MPVLTRKDRGSIGVRHKDDIVLGVDSKNLIIKFQMISVLTRRDSSLLGVRHKDNVVLRVVTENF